MKNLFVTLLFGLFSSLAMGNPIDVSFYTSQGLLVTGKLYVPPDAPNPAPAVVMMHGCSGMYSYSNQDNGLALLYKEWGQRLASAGYFGLVVDSFSARGVAQNQCGNSGAGVSEVYDRPYDAYGAAQFLINEYGGVDPSRIVLLGWSHGGSSTLSAMAEEMKSQFGPIFRGAFAFYPGCGLYGAFGGIGTSTYVPYSPLIVLHAALDPLYTVGYCDQRKSNSEALGSSNFRMFVYSGAQHSFDNARRVEDPWTQSDVYAKYSADSLIMQILADVFAQN